MEAIGTLRIPGSLLGQAEAAEPAERAGNPHGWVLRVMRAEGSGILRLLHRVLGNEADALDAFQDCFCKLAVRGNGGGLRSARAYAYRTATNIAIELIRSRRRRDAHLPALADRAARRGDSASLGSSNVPTTVISLQEAVAALPGHLRGVIVLRDLSGMSYEDVGRTLGIDPATARVYRRHAVVRLAELLGGQSADEE